MKKVLQKLSMVLLAITAVGTAQAQHIVTTGTVKTQVWDLGAEALSTDTYENMLTADIINGWYDGIAGGSTGKTIPSTGFQGSAVNFTYETAGAANHRLRTTNTAITRYDSKSQKDASSTVYNGYIYSNSSSNSNVYVKQTYSADDKVEFMVGSNGNPETYHLVGTNYDKTFNFTETGKVSKATFYIPADGEYKLYGADEKLVLARIYRTPATYVEVSGSVTAPASIGSAYKIRFTNDSNGNTTDVTPANGTYSAVLAKDYTYTVSLVDANDFVISSTSPLSVDGTKTYNVNISAVNKVAVSGSITGLPNDILSKATLKVTIPSGKIFQPVITVNATDVTYSTELELNTDYTLSADGVNDYALKTITLNVAAATTSQDITFEKKPTYAITINPTGATLADLAASTFTFTNLNEDGYVYEFTGTDDIALRDGTYSVKVANTGKYAQMLTSNLKVNGATITKQIDFSSDPVTYWTFSASDFTGTSPYNTLIFSGGQKNKIYLLMGKGSVKVPISGAGKVTVKACYQYYFGDMTASTKTGSTSQIDAFSYDITADEITAGYKEIPFMGTSYITEISVNYALDYAATITVGKNKSYKTITSALAAISQMTRTSDQSVTVMIDPGNYEEMLTIDQDNVIFKNAAETPSIAIKNAGLDIDENAVRITGYYGHGYNYASMDDDFSWNERKLQVNKENGYASITNKGGSDARLWNSTVLVSGKNFQAYNIIFENSFNQYISAKEANDLVAPIAGSTMAKVTRPTTVGSTEVQKKSYVERASAIGFKSSASKAYFENCRFIGHQDVIYGDQGARVAVNGGVLMGGTDYIFGGMTFVAYKSDIAINVETDKNDVAYITASKNTSGRGYLFANCTVKSVEPKTEMACTTYAKPAYFGRPWDKAAETVFAGCYIEQTKAEGYTGSMIGAEGWNNGLTSTGSSNTYEYNNFEQYTSATTANRVSWANILTEASLTDGTEISLLNWTKGSDNWDPFNSAEISYTNPYSGTAINAVENAAETVKDGKYIINNQVIIVKDGKKFSVAGVELK